MLTRWDVRRVLYGASKLLHLQLRGDGPHGDDENSASADADVTVAYQPLGLSVLPLVSRTLQALGFEDGDEVGAVCLVDKARSPTDLASGETRLWSVGNVAVRVRLRSNTLVIEARGATITITPDGAVQVTPAAGQNVVLAGGSARVARQGDAVSATDGMATWITQVTATLNTLAGPGTVTVPSGFGTCAAGAERVRA